MDNGLQDELKRRLEFQLLLGGWNKQRGLFVADLEGRLSQSIMTARKGGAPLRHDRHAQQSDELSLSLVDDAQVLKDVAIAHVTQEIEDQSRAELHQLTNFFAALRGIARPLKSDNPLRAALFAQAVAHTIDRVPLDADSRYTLMRLAAQPLTISLHRLYVSLCKSLRSAQLSGLLTSHGSASKEAERRQRWLGTVPDMPTQHATPRAALAPAPSSRPDPDSSVPSNVPATAAMSEPAALRSAGGNDKDKDKDKENGKNRQDHEQHLQAWRRRLRGQLQRQLDQAQAGKLVRRFLLGPWTEVIAQVMFQHGAEASETRSCMDVVTTLIHSISPQPDDAARERLRARLPSLIEALNRGMEAIALPAMERKDFLDALMRKHGRVLQLPGCLLSR
ncbi:DUF1631 family protein [Roseateles chitinivorans]|uniref:DUF1631 family protein n=1 Tax=Roseateles chitinivorans TaxID=2917965 RepID=UPI003D6702E7